MDSFKEEQLSEIEALQSIYLDEIHMLDEDPYCFMIPVNTSDSYNNEEEISIEACIQFTFTEKYPEEIPIMEISSSNLNEKDEQDLLDLMKEEAINNIGMVMIFTLVSIIQDYLETIVSRIKEQKDAAKKLFEIELQKEEEKKYHGTPVTVESFTKWKISFDVELRKKSGRKETEETATKKLTGRKMFESDATLQFSDSQFYTEGSSAVQVDESLFQDLDDLDLDDN